MPKEFNRNGGRFRSMVNNELKRHNMTLVQLCQASGIDFDNARRMLDTSEPTDQFIAALSDRLNKPTTYWTNIVRIVAVPEADAIVAAKEKNVFYTEVMSHGVPMRTMAEEMGLDNSYIWSMLNLRYNPTENFIKYLSGRLHMSEDMLTSLVEQAGGHVGRSLTHKTDAQEPAEKPDGKITAAEPETPQAADSVPSAGCETHTDAADSAPVLPTGLNSWLWICGKTYRAEDVIQAPGHVMVRCEDGRYQDLGDAEAKGFPDLLVRLRGHASLLHVTGRCEAEYAGAYSPTDVDGYYCADTLRRLAPDEIPLLLQ